MLSQDHILNTRLKIGYKDILNTKLKQKEKSNCGKDFFKLMNNIVFGKTMGNVIKIEILKGKDKKLFSSRTKLSYCKVFLRKIY